MSESGEISAEAGPCADRLLDQLLAARGVKVPPQIEMAEQDISTREGESGAWSWGLGSAQGWRVDMEDAHTYWRVRWHRPLGASQKRMV